MPANNFKSVAPAEALMKRVSNFSFYDRERWTVSAGRRRTIVQEQQIYDDVLLKDEKFSDTDGVDGRKYVFTNSFVSEKLELDYIRIIVGDAKLNLNRSLAYLLLFDFVCLITAVFLQQTLHTLIFIGEIILIALFAATIVMKGSFYQKYFRSCLCLLFFLLVNLRGLPLMATSNVASHQSFMASTFPKWYTDDEEVEEASLTMFIFAFQSICLVQTCAILFNVTLTLPYREVLCIVVLSASLQSLSCIISHLMGYQKSGLIVLLMTATILFVSLQISIASHGEKTTRRCALIFTG